MKMVQGLPIGFTAQATAIERHGDAVWIEICDTFPRGEWLKILDVIARLKCMERYTERTKYQIVRAVLRNVHAEYRDNPEDCPIEFEHLRPRYFRLT